MTIEFLLDSWKFFRAHFFILAVIVLAFTVPLEIVSMFYRQLIDYEGSYFLMVLPEVVNVLFYPIYGAAIVFYMASVLDGQRLSVSEAWGLGLKHWASYLVLSVILIIAISFGMALFILPGLFLAAKFAFSEFELLLKNKNPIDSLSSSWQQTEKHLWTLLKGGLVITGVIYLPYMLVIRIVGDLSSYGDLLGSVSRIIESLLMVLYTVFAFRVYDYASGEA